MNYGIKKTSKDTMTVKLSNLKPGDIFRWQGTSWEDAMAQKDDATFFMVIALPKIESDRVGCVSLDGKTVLVRDGIHLVHHETDCTLFFERL